MIRRAVSLVTGFALALAVAPGLVLAADGHGESTFVARNRAMDPSTDWSTIVMVTVLAVLALAVIIALGYMYRRQRGLEWEFQKPDAPHDDHH